jgi:hypothetical protein
MGGAWVDLQYVNEAGDEGAQAFLDWWVPVAAERLSHYLSQGVNMSP